MPAAEESPDGRVYDPFEQFQHELKTPLTIISGRTHLLARTIRRSPSLTDEERARMLEGLTAIEDAVRAMVSLIEGMGGSPHDKWTDSTAGGR